jgi:clan AA aspartic protease (TIGR02281 family)
MESDSELSGYSDNTFYFALIGAVLLLAFAGGFVYWRYGMADKTSSPSSVPSQVEHSAVYQSLGIAPLPSSIEKLPQIRGPLDRLNREPCYKDAIADLADHLIKVGYPREAATSLRSFVQRCKNSEGLLRIAYSALESLSDYRGALEVADQLVQAYPANGTFLYWRGTAYDQLGDSARALLDYINTAQLVADPKHINGDVFYDASRMYAKLGRYCDAITPIETYISLDPANRRTPQTTSIISEYADQGKCDRQYASGTARVPILGATGVHSLTVVVNGVAGNLILDTGATFVSVTPQFASKARIDTEPDNQVIMKTVGGTALADIGYAAKIAVGKAEASGVVVAVHRGSAKPFGDGLDGLLGMSFLARFQLNISPTAIELTPIPLR